MFISYCWANSQDAVNKGSGKVEGALGHYDPRWIKSFLEKNRLRCWLDTDQIGKVNRGEGGGVRKGRGVREGGGGSGTLRSSLDQVLPGEESIQVLA